MATVTNRLTIPTHDWLQQIRVAYVPGAETPLVAGVARNLMDQFARMGHTVLPVPEGDMDVVITSARYGEPVNWKEALFFTSKRRFHLDHAPTVFTLIQITPRQLDEIMSYFRGVLVKPEADPADYNFPGLSPRAPHTMHEQGRRGGPILALARLLQSQSMCIRIILVVGEDSPLEAYTFDLVGAFPRSDAADPEAFYSDLVLRIVTAVSTHEITSHVVVGDPIRQEEWARLATPAAMRTAGRELGVRNFFTEMVVVGNLVSVPSLSGAISSQYSEGCYATWDTDLGALVATITGSARPVEKENLTDDELAVIAGIRPDGLGALVRQVEGKRNDPPSSEAVEMIEMDGALPHVPWKTPGGEVVEVPVARSKLHGHRGVRSYDPKRVEHVHLNRAYYHYPVSCSTEAQARAIQNAFSGSQALIHPEDPRQVVFTQLPGHGIVVVEKWLPGKIPFQVIWEAMDAGALEIDNLVPQGPFIYEPGEGGRMVLKAA
ncbi:MAG TPA: hypothetical protein VF813_00775 [Anaerolineaceae bacterium]